MTWLFRNLLRAGKEVLYIPDQYLITNTLSQPQPHNNHKHFHNHHSNNDNDRVVLEGGGAGAGGAGGENRLSEFFGAEQEDHRVGMARLRAQLVHYITIQYNSIRHTIQYNIIIRTRRTYYKTLTMLIRRTGPKS